MALSNDYMDRIRKKYSVEVDEPTQQREQNIGDFKRLMDYMSQNNNTDLWIWVSQQESVVKARETMEDVFQMFMFEAMKSQFVTFCDNISSTVVKDYVDASIAKSKEYVSPTVQFEEEKKSYQETIKQQALMIEELRTKSEREVVKI